MALCAQYFGIRLGLSSALAHSVVSHNLLQDLQLSPPESNGHLDPQGSRSSPKPPGSRRAMISQQCSWVFKTQEHLHKPPTQGCALKSREGILCGTLPQSSGISSVSPNESACIYLCSACLTLFLKCPTFGSQS